jgi:hypothetical protein
LWQRDQNQAGHMILFPESGELICYDYDQDAGTEQCLVVDVQTGREKARVAIGSPVQCVVFPAAGWHRDFYITTFTTIARVYVQ